MIKISLFEEARQMARNAVHGHASVMVDNNLLLSRKEKLELADYFLIAEKLDFVVDYLKAIVMHSEHGIKGTTPEGWNLLSSQDKDTPYCAYDAILNICEYLEKLPLFPLNVFEFIRQVPSIQRRVEEFVNESANGGTAFVDERGEIKMLSFAEKVKNLDTSYLERIEQTFGLESYPHDILHVKAVAATKSGFEKILATVKQ